jgi:hypothetical protein
MDLLNGALPDQCLSGEHPGKVGRSLFKIEARRVVLLGSLREQSQNFRAYKEPA